jgi:hypothetical protein
MRAFSHPTKASKKHNLSMVARANGPYFNALLWLVNSLTIVFSSNSTSCARFAALICCSLHVLSARKPFRK